MDGALFLAGIRKPGACMLRAMYPYNEFLSVTGFPPRILDIRGFPEGFKGAVVCILLEL